MTWQDYIKEALCYDVAHFTIEDIESGIATGDYQLWEAENSALVTSGVKLQSGGIGVKILAAGGTYDEVVGLINDVEQEARLAGCEALMTTGRRGWRKTAKDLQWKEVSRTLVKALN